MFETTPNQRTVKLTLERGKLARLLIALSAAAQSAENDKERADGWRALHDELRTVLEQHDERMRKEQR
ncbi:MAG: hypothetical protein KBS59_03130 [Clostridiales bacterium]|nr:hypothetical protein [Clostridiales bacterium]